MTDEERKAEAERYLIERVTRIAETSANSLNRAIDRYTRELENYQLGEEDVEVVLGTLLGEILEQPVDLSPCAAGFLSGVRDKYLRVPVSAKEEIALCPATDRPPPCEPPPSTILRYSPERDIQTGAPRRARPARGIHTARWRAAPTYAHRPAHTRGRS